MSTPSILITSAFQEELGGKTIKITYTLSNIANGASQEFYVDFIHMNEYDDSASNSTFTKILDLTDYWNDFGTYRIRLWVYNSSATEDKAYQDIDVVMRGNRPLNFTFPSSVTSGAPTTTVTASKWNDFQDRINEFQAYKGVDQTRFNNVSSGDIMTASIMRQAWGAINNISGHGIMPAQPNSGATICASWFHDLANALNNID